MEERFWEKVERFGPDECWKWKGAKIVGYGVIAKPGAGSGRFLAHRYSYMINVGPISDEISVCHRCDNPECTNPTHLFLGTHSENMADSVAKGRFVLPINGVINKRKTHCLRGHEFTPDNTSMINGARRCRMCCRDKMRAHRSLRPRSTAVIRAKKTHCKNGHDYTPENTYLRKNGWRACRECHLSGAKRRYRKPKH